MICLQLTDDELVVLKSQLATASGSSNLRSQFVTSSWGGRRYLPYAFTEQGVAMLFNRDIVSLKMLAKLEGYHA